MSSQGMVPIFKVCRASWTLKQHFLCLWIFRQNTDLWIFFLEYLTFKVTCGSHSCNMHCTEDHITVCLEICRSHKNKTFNICLSEMSSLTMVSATYVSEDMQIVEPIKFFLQDISHVTTVFHKYPWHKTELVISKKCTELCPQAFLVTVFLWKLTPCVIKRPGDEATSAQI